MKRDQVFKYYHTGHPMHGRLVKFVKEATTDANKCIVRVIDAVPGFPVGSKLLALKTQLGAIEGLQVGDEVGYKRSFLKSIACGPTDDMWRARGEIVKIKRLGDTQLATLKWNMPDIPEKVNVANLAKVGSAAFND